MAPDVPGCIAELCPPATRKHIQQPSAGTPAGYIDGTGVGQRSPLSLRLPNPRSLKTRVTVLTLLVFVAGLWSMAFYASRELRRDMQEQLGSQQRAVVAVLAASLSREVRMRLQALERTAALLGPLMPSGVEAMQARLDADQVSGYLFNRGIFAVGRDGVGLASSPVSFGRTGIDYADRDYIRAALDRGEAMVGKPVIGKPLGKPVLTMAVPVRNAQGEVVGALAGTIDLGRPSFLDAITAGTYGSTGGYFIVAPRARLIVTATDPSRIMQALPPPGAHPTIDRIVAGRESTVVLRNQVGEEVLNSGQRVDVAGWDIVASLPTREAFAPIDRLVGRMLAVATVLTLLAGGAIGWVLRQQLKPAIDAAAALARQNDRSLPLSPLPVGPADEVGRLISGFNQLLASLRESNEAFRVSDQALRQVSDAVVICAPDGSVISMNEAHQRVTGYGPADLVGRNCRILQGPQTDPAAVRAMHDAVANGHAYSGEVLNYRKDGQPFWNDLTISPVHDADGRVTHFIGVTRDATQRREMQAFIVRQALYDALTELPNRRLLLDRLDQALLTSKRSGLHGALLYVDLDHFKALNDTHGHAQGDQLLVEAARRLRGSVREADTVARLGGDEFVVLLDGLAADASESTRQAQALTDKIRAALAQPYRLSVTLDGGATMTVEHRCTASVGIALFPAHGLQPQEILRAADAAMYQDKQRSRG